VREVFDTFFAPIVAEVSLRPDYRDIHTKTESITYVRITSGSPKSPSASRRRCAARPDASPSGRLSAIAARV
jgi:hypothetical protein